MRFLDKIAIAILIHNITGSLINLPCKETQEWKNYVCQCPRNHTIYIKQHIIEDGFQRLSPIDSLFGCNTRDAVYCGAQFPVNHTIQRNNSAFAYFVKECNGNNQCNLSLEFFQRMETSLRKSCDNSKRPEFQNASFRQSIDYECIQDKQVVDMCVNRKDTRSPRIYLQSTGNNGSCSCHVSGDVSRVEILQTFMVELLMSDNGNFLYVHKNHSVDLYGVKVPSSANEMVMKIKKHSTESRVLIKVTGNITFYCIDEEFTNTTIEQSQSSSPLNKKAIKDSTSTLASTSDLDAETMPKSSYSKVTHSNTGPKKSSTTTNKQTNDVSLNKAEMRSMVLVFTTVIVLIIILLLCSIIQRSKDRDLLKAILYRLEENGSDTRVPRTEGTRTNPVQRSESNRNYQEIPLQFLNHPRVKNLSNAVYDSGTLNREDANGEDQQDGYSMANSLGAQSDRFLLENGNDKGVYELQRNIET